MSSPLERIAVFGRDDRSQSTSAVKAFERSVGLMVNARERLVCTAFCVDDRVVATAAHCLFRTADDTPPRLSDFTFLRGLGTRPGAERSGVAGSEDAAAEQNVVAGSRRLSVRPPIEAARDWALVRLAKPLCRGSALAIARQTPDEIITAARDKRLFQIGYHRDVSNWRLTIASGCGAAQNFEAGDWKDISRDFVAAEHLLLHSCDTGGASSGSPLLIETKSGPRVVGINVGTYLQTKVVIESGEVVHRGQASAVANTGVITTAFLDRIPTMARQAPLAAAAAIRELKQLLADRAFFHGSVDGRFDNDLQQAIEGFEGAAGLPVTGYATRPLLERLGGSGTSAAASSDSPVVAGSHRVTRWRPHGSSEKTPRAQR
jgi:protease YdgD